MVGGVEYVGCFFLLGVLGFLSLFGRMCFVLGLISMGLFFLVGVVTVSVLEVHTLFEFRVLSLFLTSGLYIVPVVSLFFHRRVVGNSSIFIVRMGGSF